MQSNVQSKAVEADSQAAPAAADTPATPPAQDDGGKLRPIDINHARPSRLGWLLLLLGFGGFALWAALAPLDQGVPTSGQVVVTGNRKTVQNLAVGKVQEILVKDGDKVAGGQPLIKLDSTSAQSQLEIARGQWIVARAVEARLIAEALGRPGIDFSPELLTVRGDARAARAIELQSQLFVSRRAALEAELAAMRNSISGIRASMQGLEAAREAKQQQVALLGAELERLRGLAKDGYLAANRVSEQDRLLAELSGALSGDIANLARLRQGIGETEMRMLARQKDFRKEVESQLTDVQREVASLESRIKALEFELVNTVIASPADGVVVGLKVHTVGAVLPAASPLMEIVPENEPLRVEILIPTTLIDKVRPGMPVEILFPAFNQRTTPQIPGELEQVSADALYNEQMKSSFYTGHVVVTADGMVKLHANEIRPGMPAEVFINTGERTMLNYLFKPLLDRTRTALTEE